MHQFKDTFDWISELDIGEFKRDEIKMRNIFTKSIVPKIVYDQNRDAIVLLEEKQTLISQKLKDSKIEQKESIQRKNRNSGEVKRLYCTNSTL